MWLNFLKNNRRRSSTKYLFLRGLLSILAVGAASAQICGNQDYVHQWISELQMNQFIMDVSDTVIAVGGVTSSPSTLNPGDSLSNASNSKTIGIVIMVYSMDTQLPAFGTMIN